MIVEESLDRLRNRWHNNKSRQRTNSGGLMSTNSFQTGLPGTLPTVPHAIVPDGTSVGNFQLSRKYRAGRKRQASDCENGLELPKFVKTSLTGSLLAGDRRD